MHVGGKAIGGPPARFTASLRRHGRLLNMDRVVIEGLDGVCGESSLDGALQLSETEQEIMMFSCKDRVSEIAMSNVSAADCNDWLQWSFRSAPLSSLRLSAVFGEMLSEGDQDSDYAINNSFRIEPPESCNRLESLTVVGCRKDIHLRLLANWVMPSLVSLTLDVRVNESHYQYAPGSLSRSLQSLVSMHQELGSNSSLTHLHAYTVFSLDQIRDVGHHMRSCYY